MKRCQKFTIFYENNKFLKRNRLRFTKNRKQTIAENQASERTF